MCRKCLVIYSSWAWCHSPFFVPASTPPWGQGIMGAKFDMTYMPPLEEGLRAADPSGLGRAWSSSLALSQQLWFLHLWFHSTWSQSSTSAIIDRGEKWVIFATLLKALIISVTPMFISVPWETLNKLLAGGWAFTWTPAESEKRRLYNSTHRGIARVLVWYLWLNTWGRGHGHSFTHPGSAVCQLQSFRQVIEPLQAHVSSFIKTRR